MQTRGQRRERGEKKQGQNENKQTKKRRQGNNGRMTGDQDRRVSVSRGGGEVVEGKNARSRMDE